MINYGKETASQVGMKQAASKFMRDTVIGALGVIFEGISNDLNSKPNGTTNARPDLQRQWSNPKAENDKWFGHTLPEKYERLSEDARIGWRDGIFPEPGRTVLERDSQQAQNVSASCTTSSPGSPGK